MAFALTVVELKSSLEEAGCPICGQKRRETQRSVAAYLSERLMDRGAREKLMGANGFCPQHLYMMVTQEMRDSGDPLGANIIYEQLSGRTRKSLETWQQEELQSSEMVRWFQQTWRRLLKREKFPLSANQPCPICFAVNTHVERTLAALMEELNRGTEDITSLYRLGDGLCLVHFKQALSVLAVDFPAAAKFMVEDTLFRLEKQQNEMGEYIRKHNWSYRDEQLSLEEERAWRKTVAFYSGFPPDSFQPFAWPPDGVK
jgi:hypothetical protein